MDTLCFRPTVVTRGRLFKGHGYVVGFGGTSSGWCYNISKLKIWDPVAKTLDYANEDFCEDDPSVTPEQLEADKTAYLSWIVDDAVAYCTRNGQDPNAVETVNHIRNLLKSKLPMDIIDEKFPDKTDVADQVKNAIEWAMSLKTKPMTLYGRHCLGGKDYSPRTKAERAYKRLHKIGATRKEGFKAAWGIYVAMYHLPDVSEAMAQKLQPNENV